VKEPRRISSRDNPLLVRLRRLAQDPGGYRQAGQVWLEGEHLCSALRARGRPAALALLPESSLPDPAQRALADWAAEVVLLPDRLFAAIGGLPSPARIGFVAPLPAPAAPDLDATSIVLDRVQDAGNVGSILRSAAAFGVAQVLALRGTAALWSPKVLRAGMGAHFALRLCEGLGADDLRALRVPLLATSAHGGESLPQAALPPRAAWVFGHEGQGVAPDLLARCALAVRIPQPGGEESLNVAAAAAVCLYEGARRQPPSR
jgi:TrmH family RNA methyltransferase